MYFFAETMESSQSYSPNYFSLEDILATQERVPCQVQEDLTNLGFLDPGSDSQHLPRGTKLELPFWMVEGLKTNKVTSDWSIT